MRDSDKAGGRVASGGGGCSSAHKLYAACGLRWQRCLTRGGDGAGGASGAAVLRRCEGRIDCEVVVSCAGGAASALLASLACRGAAAMEE